MRCHAKYCLAAVAAIAAVDAAAAVCRDEKGTTSYQEEPCPERKGDPKLVPVRAASPDERSMREAMRRVQQALNTRDSRALAKMYAADFRMVTRQLDGKVVNVDYKRMMRDLHAVLDAGAVNVSYQCKPAKATAAHRGALQCLSSGNIKYGSRLMESAYDERIEFAVEEGELRVQLIDAVERKPRGS